MSKAILKTCGGSDTVDGRPSDLYLQYVTRYPGSSRKEGNQGEAILNARVEDRGAVEGASKITGIDAYKHRADICVALTCL